MKARITSCAWLAAAALLGGATSGCASFTAPDRGVSIWYAPDIDRWLPPSVLPASQLTARAGAAPAGQPAGVAPRGRPAA